MKEPVKKILLDLIYTPDAKPRFMNDNWLGGDVDTKLKRIDTAVDKIIDMCYEPYADLKLARDSESLNIYIDMGDDKDPINVCYWHEDEWLEDAETVVPAMLTAMELFYTNPKELLTKLGVEI